MSDETDKPTPIKVIAAALNHLGSYRWWYDADKGCFMGAETTGQTFEIPIEKACEIAIELIEGVELWPNG